MAQDELRKKIVEFVEPISTQILSPLTRTGHPKAG